MIKELIGIKPQSDGEGFSPSPLAIRLATEEETTYSTTTYAQYAGTFRVLMVCTEEQYMTMANDKKFSTGNHPVEMFVPMLHMRAAGFHIDVATPTGQPVALEMWAMPSKDPHVKRLYGTYRDQLERPLSLEDVCQNLEDSPYGALFIPGGHGAMLGLPQDTNMARLLKWIMETDRTLLSICHGPAALLAAQLNGDDDFEFAGFEITAFPDVVDQLTPYIGYLPGPMPWKFGARLEEAGVQIINTMPNGNVHRDRNVVTGDSPRAADAFGKLAVETLLERMPTS